MPEFDPAFDKPQPVSVQTTESHGPIDILLKYMRSGFRGITGSPVNFCRVLCEFTEGDIGRSDRRNELLYGWYTIGGQKKDILRLKNGLAFEMIYEIDGEITLKSIDQRDFKLLEKNLNIHPINVLISKFEIEKEFKTALEIYKRKQQEMKQQAEADKRRLELEDNIETVLKRIENASSDDALPPIKGIKNIYALIGKGFIPGICDNPDLWVDAEEFASLYYVNIQTGEEVLLIGREKLQAVTEQDRIEYKFLVAKSNDKPKEFNEKKNRFNKTKSGESRNWEEDFFKGLDVLTKYPEELKNKTVADLEVMATAIDGAIGERSRIEEGLIPFDALYKKETRKILVEVSASYKPLAEIRKTLDYLEHTGMVQPPYKASLYELLKMGKAGLIFYDHLVRQNKEGLLDFIHNLPRHHTIDIRKILEGTEIKEISGSQSFKDHIYVHGEISSPEIHKKRIKVVVAAILKNIPGKINAENITLAMQPYIEELGLDELDKIKQRILELKEVVARQHQQP